jgi:hypothetical protein
MEEHIKDNLIGMTDQTLSTTDIPTFENIIFSTVVDSPSEDTIAVVLPDGRLGSRELSSLPVDNPFDQSLNTDSSPTLVQLTLSGVPEDNVEDTILLQAPDGTFRKREVSTLPAANPFNQTLDTGSDVTHRTLYQTVMSPDTTETEMVAWNSGNGAFRKRDLSTFPFKNNSFYRAGFLSEVWVTTTNPEEVVIDIGSFATMISPSVTVGNVTDLFATVGKFQYTGTGTKNIMCRLSGRVYSTANTFTLGLYSSVDGVAAATYYDLGSVNTSSSNHSVDSAWLVSVQNGGYAYFSIKATTPGTHSLRGFNVTYQVL